MCLRSVRYPASLKLMRTRLNCGDSAISGLKREILTKVQPDSFTFRAIKISSHKRAILLSD